MARAENLVIARDQVIEGPTFETRGNRGSGGNSKEPCDPDIENRYGGQPHPIW